MTKTEPDHFVIAALTLEEGINYIQSKLGVVIPQGGKHPKMGTHNCLMNLGNTFLELIAIDPDKSPERKPRWYNLDAPDLQQKLTRSPQLITWVARTDNIDHTARQSKISLGTIEQVSRGDLTWKITVPKDGSLPEHGLFPTLIEWPENIQPWTNMKNLGFNFEKLTLSHPNRSFIQQNLTNIGLSQEKIEITEKTEIRQILQIRRVGGELIEFQSA